MAATVNGILEPVVVDVSDTDTPSDDESAAKVATTIGSNTGSYAAAGAGACSELGIFGVAICGVVGAIVGAVKGAIESIVDATSTTPTDAHRFLYETAVPQHRARLVRAVPARDRAIIRHARYLALATRSNYGRDTLNGWLQTAGETSGDERENPLPLEAMIGYEAEAYLAMEQEVLATGNPSIPVLTPDAPALAHLGAHPLERAILARLTDPVFVAELLHNVTRREPPSTGAVYYWTLDPDTLQPTFVGYTDRGYVVGQSPPSWWHGQFGEGRLVDRASMGSPGKGDIVYDAAAGKNYYINNTLTGHAAGAHWPAFLGTSSTIPPSSLTRAALEAWVAHLQQVAGDHGPNPIASAAPWASVKTTTGGSIEGAKRRGFLWTAGGTVYRPLGWWSGLYRPVYTPPRPPPGPPLLASPGPSSAPSGGAAAPAAGGPDLAGAYNTGKNASDALNAIGSLGSVFG